LAVQLLGRESGRSGKVSVLLVLTSQSEAVSMQAAQELGFDARGDLQPALMFDNEPRLWTHFVASQLKENIPCVQIYQSLNVNLTTLRNR
jgi:hypothetical protein